MKVKIEKKEPLNQSHLLVGFLSCDLKHSMRYPLKLLSSALAGQGGRLFMELRDKQSLAYQVAPIHSDTLDKGMFGFYIGCSSEKLTTAIHGIRRELDRVLNDKISKVELERAKSYWLGRFELEMQRYSSQAMLYGMDELVGLGFEHSLTLSETIRKITQEDIQKAAQTFLVPEKAVISIVHPSDLEEGFIKRAWEGATLINTKVKSLKKGSL
jgi:zinc protease